MEFIVRILFTGLIALIPNENGTELDVLLLNVGHAHHLSDGSRVAQHVPIFLARSGNCTGDCPTDDLLIARALFSDKSDAAALAALEAAITANGAAWQLSGSEIGFRKGSTGDPELPALNIRRNVRNGIVPATSLEREDYSWIAALQQVCSTCTLNPDVLATQPPSGLVAARLKLRSGKVFTYSVARIGNKVRPVHFKRLDGTGSASSYSQAIAAWVATDIAVAGDSIEIVETKFAGGPGRSMKLEPDAEGKVEIAVLNLPPFVPPASPDNDAPQVGKHFERYYDLAQTPPAVATRLVPLPGAAPGAPSYADVDWQTVHPQETLWSPLLNQLRLDVGRGVYDRTLCPPVSP